MRRSSEPARATRRRPLPSLLALLAALCIAVGVLPSCSAPISEDVGAVDQAAGRPRRPVDFVERFPEAAHVHRAMDYYARDPAGARMEPPISVAEFFGTQVASANLAQLHIERLRPDARYQGKPLAFLNAYFHGTDTYWNNRYKDVQLSKLFDAIGIRYVFPEAVHVPHEGRALVRIWTDYTPVSKGTPEGLSAEALLGEVARMLVSSYVAGNVDGPAHNGSNGGFAKFRDVSGRELWRGVLIDNGASWNAPGEAQKPWNTNVLGTGPVKAEHLPVDVREGLVRMAQATRTQLAEWSRFERIDDGARAIVEGQRARAREILEHYGIGYTPGQ